MAVTPGVLLLLLELSCGGSALWRYSSRSPHHHIISTRSAIKLEYEGALFSEWQVPETCSIQDKKSPKTEMHCSQGVHAVKPIVTGPKGEEERYLPVDTTYICFLWYYTVINIFENLTQVVSIWVYDPEYADSDELLWQAEVPSLHSRILTNHFAILGQKPIIYTTIRRKTYTPDNKLINWTWRVTLPMTRDDVIKNIRGNQVIFQDCFVADFTFLLTFPVWLEPEIPGFLPITSPAGSQLMLSWDACFPSLVVVVTDMETFQTNDSFSTWTRVTVPPNILSDAERHNVDSVLLLRDSIYFLINGVLYLKDTKELTKLGREKHLPEGEILGITSRRWCWIKYIIKNVKVVSSIAIWTEDEIYFGYSENKFVKIITTAELKSLLNLPPSGTLTIHNIDYTGHPLELAVLLNYCITCTNTKKIYIVIYNEDSMQWVPQDFVLDVPIASFFIPRFLLSGMPELILWDKHKVYYSYQNFTTTGVLQTSAGHGNLSALSKDSVIHDIYVGDSLRVWVEIIYPENTGLDIIVKVYGPQILEYEESFHYEVASGYCTNTLTMTFYSNVNYEGVDDYFNFEYKNMGNVFVQLRPSQHSNVCPVTQKVFQIGVGCDPQKFIGVKGFSKTACVHHEFFYEIDKSHLRHKPLENLKVRYDWEKYGCPLRLNGHEKFQPLIQLFDDSGHVDDVAVNFILWEIHGRNDYSYNNTMKQSGCLNEAQTWKTMIELNADLPLEEVWGPENYRSCFSYAIGKPGDLDQPYEIINISNNNHIFWPLHHSGMYVFRVKILDPNYSFCNLTAIFAIEIFGVIPRPSGYLVSAIVFVMMLLFISILVLSYFQYTKLYQKSIYKPYQKIHIKQKTY
ncbi:cation channel sperm-associated protein subunit epsilon isoform X4 [Fukomys damarensis]|uniref:cation channel sperm-associated protein subunit epsilon isoform X4 n=1 Tax=Fukomys damarensis TaxID=885580 RepID=UPI00053F4155|nr:cation channel sperm-associated protein subunit epsilon isoform X4 [Fukomys damarensis]